MAILYSCNDFSFDSDGDLEVENEVELNRVLRKDDTRELYKVMKKFFEDEAKAARAKAKAEKDLAKALSASDMADLYDQKHGGRRARTLPMGDVFDWLEKNGHVFVGKDDYYYRTDPNG